MWRCGDGGGFISYEDDYDYNNYDDWPLLAKLTRAIKIRLLTIKMVGTRRETERKRGNNHPVCSLKWSIY